MSDAAPAKKEPKRKFARGKPTEKPLLKRHHYDPEHQEIRAQYEMGEHTLTIGVKTKDLADFLGCIPWDRIPDEDALEAFESTRRALQEISK